MNLLRAGRAIGTHEFSQCLASILHHNQLCPWSSHGNVPPNVKATATPIGIAVSGGVDSMALATLLVRHVQDPNYAGALARAPLHALIVDHKLRDNSTEEANYVAEQARTLGISPHVLTLDWSASSIRATTTPGNRPEQAHLETMARLERYKAIAQQCYRLGIRHLFVGHHAGDQVETVIFRFSRASGIDGLAGIQPDAPLGVIHVQEALNLRVIRPLLGISKDRLRVTCEAAGTKWVEDPSNQSLDYQRNVIRYHQQTMDTTSSDKAHLNNPLSTASLLSFRDRMDKHCKAAWRQVSPLLADVRFDQMNGMCHIRLDDASGQIVDWLHPSKTHIATRLLSRLIRWVNCKDHSPRLEDLQTLLAHLRNPRGIAHGKGSDTYRESDSSAGKEGGILSSSTTVYRKTRKSRVSYNTDEAVSVAKESEQDSLKHQARVPRPINVSGVLFTPPRTTKGVNGHWTVSRQPLSNSEQQINTMAVSIDTLKVGNTIDLLWDKRFFLRIQHGEREGGEKKEWYTEGTLHIRPMTTDDIRSIDQVFKTHPLHGAQEPWRSDAVKLFRSNVPKKKNQLTIPVVLFSPGQSIETDGKKDQVRIGSTKQIFLSIPTLAVHFMPDWIKVDSIFKSGPGLTQDF
ncbi:hypothetical protein BGZ94_001187 [Podila epigama]|nr:hypothetical protein BGZ94_001187 [Podila epigama]